MPVIEKLKLELKRSYLYRILMFCSERRQTKQWKRNGKGYPMPHSLKRNVILAYKKQYKPDILIESGTFLGETILMLKEHFNTVYSIELDTALYRRASELFRRDKNVKLYMGDSGGILPVILSKITRPVLFWLDGHYSGGITGKGEKETPIIEELTSILQHSVDNHVILIDDARCFGTFADYPSIAEMSEMIKRYKPKYRLNIEDDIIRIINKEHIKTIK